MAQVPLETPPKNKLRQMLPQIFRNLRVYMTMLLLCLAYNVCSNRELLPPYTTRPVIFNQESMLSLMKPRSNCGTVIGRVHPPTSCTIPCDGLEQNNGTVGVHRLRMRNSKALLSSYIQHAFILIPQNVLERGHSEPHMRRIDSALDHWNRLRGARCPPPQEVLSNV